MIGNELHITKVTNGYLVKTIQVFNGRDVREIVYSESWVFPDLDALNAWMKEEFAIRGEGK